MFEVLLVAVHEEFAGLLVECAFGEGDDEQALHGLQDVVDRPGSGVPVLLERVDANLALFGDVGMEDLGDEVAWIAPYVPLGGLLGKSCSTASLQRNTPPS